MKQKENELSIKKEELRKVEEKKSNPKPEPEVIVPPRSKIASAKSLTRRSGVPQHVDGTVGGMLKWDGTLVAHDLERSGETKGLISVKQEIGMPELPSRSRKCKCGLTTNDYGDVELLCWCR